MDARSMHESNMTVTAGDGDSPSSSPIVGGKRGRSRGPTMQPNGEKKFVSANYLGQPNKGDQNHHDLVTTLGVQTRTHIPIIYADIKAVPRDNIKNIMKHLEGSFDMPDISREYLRNRIVAVWRNFKSDLYTKLLQFCCVSVLPSGTTRVWIYDELEIVKVVADQVAVAVSHAAILEESQLMREKLVEKNRQLQHARKEAMMASQARSSFQKVMSKRMRRPMHSISGLSVTFRASAVTENDQRWAMWRPNSSKGYAYIKFETGVHSTGSQFEPSALSAHNTGRKYSSGGVEGGLSFTMCKKLVQMMQGNIWVVPNYRGLAQTMTFILRFQLQPASLGLGGFFEPGGSSEHPLSKSLFRNLQVILADDDGVNKLVTKKLLEKLGCRVIAVSSGYECLSALGNVGSSFQIDIFDLHIPEKDGFKVAMRVQKFRSRSWPLIIALTASEDEDVWEKCMQVGMNGLIRKPVLLQGMADELRRVIQHVNKSV
ncbi:hypothetical protein GIB67_016158 [Kingdonia uniflora]|uniref:Response regulatory domain-containing protein n=1 Tax=Kingdonia uniflora TaxID=39325 RepID=A0A7J7NAC4_9MAGN|nr:hypothetical protein GIB67_016158 [Kingdonia uniflora]